MITIQTGNTVEITDGNQVVITAPGPQGPAGSDGGGGASWEPNSFAFIDPVNGNDTTGDGTSAKPWATANKAYTEGHFNYFIAPGDAGSITFEGFSGTDFNIIGLAANDFIDTSSGTPWSPTPIDSPTSEITIIANGADNQHVHIFSNKGVTINLTGNSSGATGPDFSVFNAIVGTVNLAGNNGGDGQDGGIGGLLSLDDCMVVGNINCDAGQAGDGGNPGNGGIINFRQCQVRGTVSALGYGGTPSEVNAMLSTFNSAPVADEISLRSSVVDGVSKFNQVSLVVTGGGSNSVTLEAPSSIPANKTFFLPGEDGTSGQALRTNGTGSLSFGTLSVAGGGTGAATLSANAVLLGNGTSAVQTVAPSTSGNVLTSNGTTWTSAAPTSGGSSNLWIPAAQFIPKTTAGCGVDSVETTTNDQCFDQLLFDSGTDEFADALVVFPNNWNYGTVTARFYWSASTSSGDVVWGIQGRAFANDDALDTAAGTAQTVTDTLTATGDMCISSATSAVTIGGTPAVNTAIQVTVYRDANAGGDTLATDARLLGVEIIYTAA